MEVFKKEVVFEFIQFNEITQLTLNEYERALVITKSGDYEKAVWDSGSWCDEGSYCHSGGIGNNLENDVEYFSIL